LELLKGHKNIVEFNRVVIDRVSRTPSIIFEYLKHQEETTNYVHNIKDPKELKKFLIGILQVKFLIKLLINLKGR